MSAPENNSFDNVVIYEETFSPERLVEHDVELVRIVNLLRQEVRESFRFKSNIALGDIEP